MAESWGGEEFARRLAAGTLRSIEVVGMARPAEGKADAFLFAPGGSCESWVEVPTALVARVESLGERPCRDHAHPLVRVTFKEPPAEQHTAALFAALLRARPRGPQYAMMEYPWDPSNWGEVVIISAPAEPGSGHPQTPPSGTPAEYWRCYRLLQRCSRGDKRACKIYNETCI